MEFGDKVVLRPRQVVALGYAPSMVGLWRLRKRGDFAPAISLGGSAIGFRKVDLDAWLAARPEVT